MCKPQNYVGSMTIQMMAGLQELEEWVGGRRMGEETEGWQREKLILKKGFEHTPNGLGCDLQKPRTVGTVAVGHIEETVTVVRRQETLGVGVAQIQGQMRIEVGMMSVEASARVAAATAAAEKVRDEREVRSVVPVWEAQQRTL